jgi:hypothetical protein
VLEAYLLSTLGAVQAKLICVVKQSLEWLAGNMVSWFSQRITVGESDWARAFERTKIDGLWRTSLG